MDSKNNQETSKAALQSRRYKRRARNIFIHKPMQREFTFVMIALLMVSTLAIGFVIHETMRDATMGGGFHFGKINPYEVLSEVSYKLILYVTMILFVTLVLIGIFGIFFLHRVAGPVYRFRQVLMRINDGEFPNFIKLREGDFFTETASEINQLIKKLRSRQEKDKTIRNKVDEILNRQGLGPEIGGQIKEIKDLAD